VFAELDFGDVFKFLDGQELCMKVRPNSNLALGSYVRLLDGTLGEASSTVMSMDVVEVECTLMVEE
jgi:hypothetical protein